MIFCWCTEFKLQHQMHMQWQFFSTADTYIWCESQSKRDDLKEQRTKDYAFFIHIFVEH